MRDAELVQEGLKDAQLGLESLGLCVAEVSAVRGILRAGDVVPAEGAEADTAARVGGHDGEYDAKSKNDRYCRPVGGKRRVCFG